jgi:hypothetical protein
MLTQGRQERSRLPEGKHLRRAQRRPVRTAIALAMVVGCVLALQAAPATAASGQYYLLVNQSLFASTNQYLINGSNKAIMQSDGNFVLYKSGAACWSTHTNGQGTSGTSIIMQADGNLVIYKYYGGPALWASNTTPFRGGHLELNVGVRVGLWITDNRTFQWPIALC